PSNGRPPSRTSANRSPPPAVPAERHRPNLNGIRTVCRPFFGRKPERYIERHGSLALEPRVDSGSAPVRVRSGGARLGRRPRGDPERARGEDRQGLQEGGRGAAQGGGEGGQAREGGPRRPHGGAAGGAGEGGQAGAR